MILEHPNFVQIIKDKLETNWVFKIYLNAVLPNRVPFDISLFLFCSSTLSSSNTLVSTEEIADSVSSSVKSNCFKFCLFVYDCRFPQCKVIRILESVKQF